MVLTGLSKKLVAIFQTMDFQNIEMYELDKQITETVVDVIGPLGALMFNDRPEVYCKESLELLLQ